MTENVVRARLRPHQKELWRASMRFNVAVCHRRFGKTYYAVLRLMEGAINANVGDWRGYYIAPTYRQAKGIAWDYLVSWTWNLPGVSINQAELRVDFANGSRIRLLGAETYNALRGLYADAAVLDETALIPGAAWTQVISPMLVDRFGWLLAIGTPMGRQNLFYELLEQARGDQEGDWSHAIYRASETGVIPADELRRQRRMMREEEYEQEFECSFQAAIRGAFYARDMADAEREGRITSVRHDPTLPVVAAVDLGWSDAMVVSFWQHAGTEHRCLRAIAYQETAIPDMVDQWRGLEFPIRTVILPHDARVHELGTGKTRREVFHELGCETVLAPGQGVHEGISQVRDILGNTWFDRDGCRMLIEAMNAYRSEFDEVRRVHSMKPLHDWASHWCDSVRYYATGRPSRNVGNERQRNELLAIRNRGIV